MKYLNLLVLSILIINCSLYAQTKEKKSGINWVTLEEADKLRQSEPRKILIDVYTDWCGWCKRMDATTFSEVRLVEYVNANYYAVKLDAEQKKPITVGGETYEYDPSVGRRGVHKIAQELLQGKMSYPTIVFLDEHMNMIQPLAGYRDAAAMQPILEYLAENAHKETPWEEWLKQREAN